MSDDTTEPAVPIHNVQTGAAVPMHSIRDLMRLAESDFGLLDRPGIGVDIAITAAGEARVRAVVSAYEVAGGTVQGGAVAERRYDGQWRGGVFVQWTRRE